MHARPMLKPGSNNISIASNTSRSPKVSRQELLCKIGLRLSCALDGLHPGRPATSEDLDVWDKLLVDLAAVLHFTDGQQAIL